MRKRYILLATMAAAAIILLNTNTVNSNQAFPQPGNCGDPVTNKSCAQGGCHPSPAQTAGPNDFTLTIGTGTPTTPLTSSFKYDPNTTYNIALLLNAFLSTPYYGFQITALDAGNNKAGAFTVSNAATTKLVSAGPYEYMGHLNASATKNWVFKWTSPAASTGPVSFYFAFNEASVASPPPTVPVGTIYTGNVTIQPNTTGINDISQSATDLRVYPNPVTDQIGLSLQLTQTATVKAELYDLDGKKMSDLMNRELPEGPAGFSFPATALASGIYLVKISVGDHYITKKIFRQ